jgi:hypothetical protein
VRDVNAVESIKLICPTGGLMFRALPSRRANAGHPVRCGHAAGGIRSSSARSNIPIPGVRSYLYSPRKSLAVLFSVGNMLSYIARAS